MAKKIKILLVDDRPENLFALESVLEADSYELIRAYSGEEALKLLLREEYAAILLDVQMPGINGFETAKIIKMREKTKYTPIIFITAINKELEHVFTGYSVGAIDYMFKPFEPETLRAKVSGFVDIYQNHKLLQAKKDELQKAHLELAIVTKELERTKTLYEIVSLTNLDAIIVFDEGGRILMANPATHRIFKYDDEELVGKSIDMLLPIFQQEGYFVTEQLIENSGMKSNGKLFPIEMQVAESFLEHGNERIYVSAIRDITERRDQVAALEYQATHDVLTGLPNRHLLYSQLKEIVHNKSPNQPFALILLDLDHFKSINDTLGHYIGDQLLIEVSYRLKQVLVPNNLVVRLGGDEFAVLIRDGNKMNVLDIVQRIQGLIRKPFTIEGQTIIAGHSMGIALFPTDATEEETLMRKADLAMYAAKSSGSGFEFYSQEQDHVNDNRVILLKELRSAITDGDLELYYQSKIDIKTKDVKGMEALIRWKHPKLGMIFPDVFIPFAEQTGLIKPLTLWVVDQAVFQIREWLDRGLDLSVSINLSARNLQEETLPNKISSILGKYQVSPELLILEITESSIMENPDRAMKVLTQLHEMGLKLSIDDFGTGYSSLAYLKHLPVNEIKVDKSFVLDMLNDKNDMIIVKSIINLAHNLSLAVTAEGVETKEILEKLQEFGCDKAQGYYFNKPLPNTQILAWMDDYKRINQELISN